MLNKARLKKISLITLGTILGFFLLVFILLQVFAGDIGRKVLEQLQAQSLTKVEASDVSVSMFPYFPAAAIRLKDIYIESPTGDTLLAAEDIAFKIGLFNLIRSKVDIKTLRVKNGFIFLEKYRNGSWSYDIFKPAPDEGSDESMAISIREAYLDRVELKYRDQTQKQDFSAFLLKSRIDLLYAGDQLEILTSYQSIIDYIGLDSTFLFKNKAFEGELHIKADLANQVYSFDKANMNLAGNPVDLKGQIEIGEKTTKLDLNFESMQGSLENVLSILPESDFEFYQQFSPEGVLDFNGSIYGDASQPVLTLSGTLKEGALSSRKLDTKAKNMEATFRMEQGANQSTFALEVSSGVIQEKPFSTKIDYSWGKKNSVQMSLNGELPAALIFGSASSGLLERCSGSFTFENISVRGNPRQTSGLVSQGLISANGVEGRLDGSSFELNKLDIELTSDRFSVNALEWECFGAEISGSGKINNYLSLFSPDPKLIPAMTLDIQVDEMDLDQWLEIQKKIRGQQQPDTVNATSSRLPDWYSWNADYNIEINDFKYQKWRIGQLKGIISIHNSKLQGDIKMQAFDGHLESKFEYLLHLSPEITGTLSTESVNIKTFFDQSDNFGQDFLTSDNLSGTLNSKMTFQGYWDEKGVFLEKKLHMDIAALIENGELKDLKMLEDFSKYVKIDDLRKIKFTSLHNLLEIRNGAVMLPVMFIQSNALNLTINGAHKFTQDVDYHLMINAGQVLVNKFKKYNPDLDPIPARENGLFNLHYRIYGPLSNIKYLSNRKAVMDAFTDGDRDRDKIRNRLIQKFGHHSIFFDSSVKNLGDEFLNGEDATTEYLDF